MTITTVRIFANYYDPKVKKFVPYFFFFEGKPMFIRLTVFLFLSSQSAFSDRTLNAYPVADYFIRQHSHHSISLPTPYFSPKWSILRSRTWHDHSPPHPPYRSHPPHRTLISHTYSLQTMPEWMIAVTAALEPLGWGVFELTGYLVVRMRTV